MKLPREQLELIFKYKREAEIYSRTSKEIKRNRYWALVTFRLLSSKYICQIPLFKAVRCGGPNWYDNGDVTEDYNNEDYFREHYVFYPIIFQFNLKYTNQEISTQIIAAYREQLELIYLEPINENIKKNIIELIKERCI